jgi:hypothetical protein
MQAGLAHVPDLNGFVQGVAAILKPSGVVVIEAPYVGDLVSEPRPSPRDRSEQRIPSQLSSRRLGAPRLRRDSAAKASGEPAALSRPLATLSPSLRLVHHSEDSTAVSFAELVLRGEGDLLVAIGQHDLLLALHACRDTREDLAHDVARRRLPTTRQANPIGLDQVERRGERSVFGAVSTTTSMPERSSMRVAARARSIHTGCASTLHASSTRFSLASPRSCATLPRRRGGMGEE